MALAVACFMPCIWLLMAPAGPSVIDCMQEGQASSGGSGSDSDSDGDSSDAESGPGDIHAAAEGDSNQGAASQDGNEHADGDKTADRADGARPAKGKGKKRGQEIDSTKLLKRRRHKKKKTAVTDWSSEDSDAAPAAILDQLNPMPGSDAEVYLDADASPAPTVSAGWSHEGSSNAFETQCNNTCLSAFHVLY